MNFEQGTWNLNKQENYMKHNMGTTDRVLRTIVAVIFGYLIFKGTVSGVLAVILGVIAVAFLVTSATGVCPPYNMFGFSTCRSCDEHGGRAGHKH